jgi:SPP1 family predicted phage head-tail adaptor
MSLPAGKLRHRVTLQAPMREQSQETGAPYDVWMPEGSVWAAIEPLSVRDFVGAEARQSQVTARITLRPITGLDETWRVLHRGKTYQIVGILPDQDTGREYVTLAVSQGPNQAGG